MEKTVFMDLMENKEIEVIKGIEGRWERKGEKGDHGHLPIPHGYKWYIAQRSEYTRFGPEET